MLLNKSVKRLHQHPSLNIISMKRDVDKLKTGMADTGSDILKLQGTHKLVNKEMKSLQIGFKEMQEKLFNNSVSIPYFY